jgi:hypothetical protein
MKSAYFTIHPSKNPPPQFGCRLKSVIFLNHRFHILHFPNSTGLFTKPTGHHYTKYRFSPDIDLWLFECGAIIDIPTVGCEALTRGSREKEIGKNLLYTDDFHRYPLIRF